MLNEYAILYLEINIFSIVLIRKFVILEAENKNEEAEDLKERIRNKLKELTERKNVPFELSVSIGSACSENGESLRDLILKADEAMYIEKKKFHKR